VWNSSDGDPPPGNQSPVAVDILPAGFAGSLGNQVIVFVHGYNNSELQAFNSCAQAAGFYTNKQSLHMYQYQGSVTGFDWPTGSLSTIDLTALLGLYKHDLAAAKSTAVPSFADFLDKLTTALAASGIRTSILAHSMGNFVMTRALMSNQNLAARLTDIYSFAPDILQSDLLLPDLIAAGNALQGKWFVYWAASDMILLTASNWANVLLGTEKFGQDRLGQAGPPPQGGYSQNVVPQQWDAFLAMISDTSYNVSIGHWTASMSTHTGYWDSPAFWQNVALNARRANLNTPITTPVPTP
jgi:pimeloyl-ACP methyl ester carboxylesterase